MLFSYVSNIFIKNAFISKTRANSAKIRPFSESAHLIYPKTVKISSAKICVLTSVISNALLGNRNNVSNFTRRNNIYRARIRSYASTSSRMSVSDHIIIGKYAAKRLKIAVAH